jgi:hypothetical protein
MKSRYTAKLVAVTKVADVPEEIMPFVRFRAELDGRELSGSEYVVILQIAGTNSYHPIFLPLKLEEIEKQLDEVDASLSTDARELLRQYVDG